MTLWSFGPGTLPAPVGRPALGAVPLAGGGCSFSVWAPSASTVSVLLDGKAGGRVEPLDPAPGGYHQAVVDGCGHGDRYRLLVDDQPLADPASRWQPDGVHGPSAVVDLAAHRWHDEGFVPVAPSDHVLYELHVGTFTPGGTFDAAVDALERLADLGVTAVEPMPIAQFPGRRNWGYDGVFPFAAQDSYGGPAAFQRFVDACHQRGLAVVLDVVYNHLGPEGNVLAAVGPYFTDRYRTPWGAALNFDGDGSDEVRRYFVENALDWLAAFHVDGLRLDAIHGIVDQTAQPFLAELSAAVAEASATLGRRFLLVAESADNDPLVVSPRAVGGLGMDAQWNDDFHHALHAALTGERLGYYEDFGRLDQLARALSSGFVHQGDFSAHRGRRHGAPSGGIDPERFVVFAQNHDHVGNRPGGERLSTLVDRPRLRLAAAVLLLAPGIPLLFMGEEYGEPAPFPYFVDHGDPALLDAVRRGRAEEFGLGWAQEPYDPGAEETYRRAVLDGSAAQLPEGASLRALYGQLLALRRRHPALRRSTRPQATADASGSVLRILRTAGQQSVAVLCNFADVAVDALLPGPVPGGTGWRKLLDSADPLTGGDGRFLPADVTGAGAVGLGPLAFCAYGSGAMEPSAGARPGGAG